MTLVARLRRSGIARIGLKWLLSLAYLVYVAGRLLELGLGRLVADPPVVELLAATTALVAASWLVDRAFGTADRPAGRPPPGLD